MVFGGDDDDEARSGEARSGKARDDAASSGAAHDTASVANTTPPPALIAYAFNCVEDSTSTGGVPDTLPAGGPTYQVVISYRDPDAVWLFLPERTVKLPLARSGSGARYSDGKTTFWNKGHMASIELPDGRRWSCAEDRRQSAIEDAKLRGMDFWGTGNEPGWTLEMGPDSIVFVTAYGTERYVLPPAQREEHNDAGYSVWRTEGEDHILIVRLTAGGCRDDMSGEPYETAVELVFDGRTLHGCGQALH